MAETPHLQPQGNETEIRRLFQIARDKTAAGRKALVDSVTDLFIERTSALSDRERALMIDILRHLVHEVEMSVRKTLAERLATFDDAPHELIVALANDEIEVAFPILVASNVLHDSDLIEVVRQRTQQHQLAVTARKSLSESVSQALVDTGDGDVIEALLNNSDAMISAETMEYLVSQSQRVDRFQNPLVRRPDLPQDLANKMYWWVSAALRKFITEKYTVDDSTIDETIEATVSTVMKEAPEGEDIAASADRVISRLKEIGDLTPDFLIKSLRQGEIGLFEAGFTRLAALRPTLARRIMFEPGGEGLAVVCKALAFDRSTFSTLFLLTRKASTNERVTDPHELNRVVRLYERMDGDAAVKVLKKWQRDADYLTAVRQLEEGP